jgi:TolB-like protein/lipopolysaccharide biosynthesis regulator YciM
MAVSPASAVTVCSTCGEPLSGRGDCVACLLRTGLDDSVVKTESSASFVFGDFEIVRREDGSLWELGRGGMGVTYLALDNVLHRRVALKVIEVPAAARGSQAVRERFLREARAAAALRHPNIAAVYHFGASLDGSRCFYAMELVEGETLEIRVRRDGPLNPKLALEIAIQVTRALMAAAAHGLIHRDLKPGNIMLSRDEANTGLEVKVIDFGVAKAIADAGGEMDLTHGGFVGTPNFASPEQFDSGPVDVRSDIYSLGATLWFALTGKTPFAGRNIEEIRRAQKSDALPIQQLKAARVSPRLRSLLKSMLAIVPAARPGAQDLAALLERCASQTAGVRRRYIALAAAVILVLGVSAFLVFPSLHTHPAAIAPISNAAPAEKSIAVLPLENLSEEKENAFFADGVQDELLSDLSKIADLKVISRTSVMKYKSGTRRNLKEIAQQLGVSNVVEGSVRRSGDHVRVSVQLVDTRTDRHLWAENYDRKVADSVSLQGELATEIATAVGATLTPQEKARVEAKPTNNPAAYDAYLRARAIPVDWGFAVKADIESAIRLYEQAVKLDPNFTLAWAYLSIAQIQSVGKGFEPSAVRLAAAKDSLDHALALDPNLPELHLARGYHEQDDTRALAEFRQAEQGLPNSADVIEAIAGVQRALGHWDEAVADLRRAIELDPRNVRASNNLALTYCAMRRFPEALATLDRVLAWDPTNARALVTKADALVAIGDLQAAEPLLANPELPAGRRARYALFQRNYAAAVEILSRDLAVEREQHDRGDILSLAFSQQLAGDVSAASATYKKAIENFRRELEKDSGAEAFTHAGLGAAYAGLGEAASAIAEGEKAMALLPSSKNPEFGPDLEGEMARIYAQLGDADHAIPMLKRLLRTQHPSAAFLTPATLRLDPIWDSIRNDPRFQELVAENAPLPEKSIAVLPFENLSKDEENAFFAGGVQDEILNDLAKVADLKVISRTSVMQYKSDLERNLREIAKTLGVSHVVEGSVQRAGERVRVSAQLIDARNDTHLWAEHYDRDVADIFAIQSEIAQQIADQLRAKLSAAEKAAIAERPTTDLAAFAYYAKANEIDIWSNWEGAEKSATRKVELLEKSTQRDPNFALAYCALAKAQIDFVSWPGEPEFYKHLELAKKAAEAALRLRPDLGEAHLELARYYFYYAAVATGANDFGQARNELEIARRKLPNNAEALAILAKIEKRQNHWDAALANLQRASQLDPRNDEVAYHLAVLYREMRLYNKGEQLVAKDTANQPGPDPWDQMALAEIKLDKGDPAAAQALLAQVPLDFSPTDEIWATRFAAALYLRDYDAANRVIAAAPAKWADFAFDGQPPHSGADAQVARARGDKQAAQRAFAAARENVDAWWGDEPKGANYFALIAKLDAGRGRKEDAIREARRAVELQPIAKDSLNGPEWVANLALVYAWTGERDRALDQLEIVATLPGEGPTYGDLRFNPCWDSLLGDKRFDKIVAAAKAASK